MFQPQRLRPPSGCGRQLLALVGAAVLTACAVTSPAPPVQNEAVIYHRAISADDSIVGMVDSITDESGRFYKKPAVFKGVAGQLSGALSGDSYSELPAGRYRVSFSCSRIPRVGSNAPVLLGRWTEELSVADGQRWRLINRSEPLDRHRDDQQPSEMEALLGVICRPYLKDLSS